MQPEIVSLSTEKNFQSSMYTTDEDKQTSFVTITRHDEHISSIIS